MRSLTLMASAVMFLGLASCSSVSDEPVAPFNQKTESGSVASTDVVRTSVTGLYVNPCISELVDVTGELQTITTKREKQDGTDELNIKFILKGDGVGRKTGDKYQLIAHTTDEFTYPIAPPYPYVRTFERVTRMVSSGSNSNAVILLTIELEVNALGKVVSRIVSSSTDCQ